MNANLKEFISVSLNLVVVTETIEEHLNTLKYMHSLKFNLRENVCKVMEQVPPRMPFLSVRETTAPVELAVSESAVNEALNYEANTSSKACQLTCSISHGRSKPCKGAHDRCGARGSGVD